MAFRPKLDAGLLGSAASGAATGTMIGGPGVGTAVGAGAGLVLGMISQAEQQGDREQAEALMRKHYDLLKDVQIPELQDMLYEVVPEKHVGYLEAQQLGPSAYEDIAVDPRYAEAMGQSLGAYDDIIRGGGLTDMDRLNYADAIRAADIQASREAADVQADMARRGLGGAGQELAARLSAGQAASERAAQTGREMQARAQQRALEAIASKGQMASGFRGQEFGEQSQQAAAKDAIARWNAQMAQDVAQQNWGYDRGLEGRRVAAEQAAAMHKASLPGQIYGMQMDRAGALGGAAGQQAGYYDRAADRTARQWGNIMQAGATLGAGYAADKRAQKKLDWEQEKHMRENPEMYYGKPGLA